LSVVYPLLLYYSVVSVANVDVFYDHSLYIYITVVMRSPKAFLASAFARIFDLRSEEEKHTKLNPRKQLWQNRDTLKEKRTVKRTAAWNARLPPIRHTELAKLCVTDFRVALVQQQSSLFGKLPLEIREMIYAYAFTEQHLHLSIRKKVKKSHFETHCPAAKSLLEFPRSCKLA
jgi:hypothetical protein